jgi:hypothetical protein
MNQLNLRLRNVNVFVIDQLAVQQLKSGSVCWLRYSNDWEATHDVPRHVEGAYAF